MTYFNALLLADGQLEPWFEVNSILNGLFRIFVILISCTNACGTTRCAAKMKKLKQFKNEPSRCPRPHSITVKLMCDEEIAAKTLKLVHNAIDVIDNDCMLCGQRLGKVIACGWPVHGPHDGMIVDGL